jgi:hypothetical protein
VGVWYEDDPERNMEDQSIPIPAARMLRMFEEGVHPSYGKFVH